ncbi:MAG: M15 family metallopeptidase [Leptolyngbyaceae bacterium]|nr:M15 family metallopeptidase [Leptolyngbyaceae bacterium]
MNNADRPGKPQPAPVPFLDDIPEAVRETSDVDPQPPIQRVVLLWGSAGLGAIAFATMLWLGFRAFQPSTAIPSASSTNGTSGESKNLTGSPASQSASSLLGHLPYKEVPEQELQALTADPAIRLRKPAAQAFENMIAAAAADGVRLVPISGFRSLADQQQLFFDVKAERGQAATKRAEVSAPPGYSEHHTGYAIDLGDWNAPAADLSPNFEKTAAFQWLQTHAVRFNFELSFPKGNPQGISYEPWHWRFVGDRDSLETFYQARSPK